MEKFLLTDQFFLSSRSASLIVFHLAGFRTLDFALTVAAAATFFSMTRTSASSFSSWVRMVLRLVLTGCAVLPGTWRLSLIYLM